MPRLLRCVVKPGQHDVLYGTCGVTTELAPNEELWWAHYGEDGEDLTVLTTRQFNIEDQCGWFDMGMQEWAWRERIDMLMLAEEL